MDKVALKIPTVAQDSVLSGSRINLGACRTFRVLSLSGTVRAKIDTSKAEIDLAAGDSFELPYGMVFQSVEIYARNGASAVIQYGMATFRSGGNSTGDSVTNDICGNVDDPNGTYVPADQNSPATYYKDQAAPPVVWFWSVANKNWFNALS